jgi:hypothetical protein
MTTTNFSAEESSLGYYFQIRYSLYLLLKNKEMINPCIQIENLDDIVIEERNRTNLYQTKLHINSVADLTDYSPDFWKTIRVWSDNITNSFVDVNNTIFTLITTAKIGESSFLQGLKYINRDDSKSILKKMKNCISSSTNKTNAKAYLAFNNIDEKSQLKLIENIFIVDSSLTMEGTLASIRNELQYSAPVGKIDLFIEYLEGWWFQQCIELLTKKISKISGIQLSQKISDIRDTFQIDNLPDDFADPISINEEELSDYEDKVFIKQLKLISIKNNLLRSAISDFRRAYDQRSKWLREDLSSLDEFESYEKQLYDNWNNIFSALKDDCEGISVDEMTRLGHQFYKRFYVERVPQIRIRPKFNAEYLTRGSCHILSDMKKIGWHPDFENLLN